LIRDPAPDSYSGVQVDLRGPAGRLEALYEPTEAPQFAAVVCHPHPLYGGTMNNHATYRLAKAVRSRRGVSLRFNFRGVGRSGGIHDAGLGEVEDVQAALAWLAERHPDLPRYACGFSFGSWMALEAGCRDTTVRGVLCAGLALSLREVASETARSCPKPVGVIQAEHDEYGSPSDVDRKLAGSVGPRRLVVVRGAAHLFTEALPQLEQEAGELLGWILSQAAPA
jgi:alpha/beta superfamily hydrolase